MVVVMVVVVLWGIRRGRGSGSWGKVAAAAAAAAACCAGCGAASLWCLLNAASLGGDDCIYTTVVAVAVAVFVCAAAIGRWVCCCYQTPGSV